MLYGAERVEVVSRKGFERKR